MIEEVVPEDYWETPLAPPAPANLEELKDVEKKAESAVYTVAPSAPALGDALDTLLVESSPTGHPAEPAPQPPLSYEELVKLGYKVDITPEQFEKMKAQGQLPYFETYEDYLKWVVSSPGLQPGAWTPPPKLPEKPTVEDVKKALEEAKSTEHVQAVIEQAKEAGIPIEMSPAFYEEGVGRFVVAFGDVASGKIVETGFAFKGGGEQNILAKQTVEVDISKEIEKAQREGFQNLQLAIEKTFMACRPEDALKISLTGVKPPEPPPPPPTYYIQVATQTPSSPDKVSRLEVPSFEEFLKEHPEVAKYPETERQRLYSFYLAKTAREKGFELVMTPSGWVKLPDTTAPRVDMLSALKQYTDIPQIAAAVWKSTEGKEYEQKSFFEAGVRGLATGFTETITSIPFSAPLLRLGALPEPPVSSVPQVAKATTVPTAIEAAPTAEEKMKAMETLAPPPQLAVYKAAELGGQIAGAAFEQWFGQHAYKVWKSIDVGEVLERYKAGESLTPLERLKLEAWIHTPEKVWKALSEATTVKTYEIPEQVEVTREKGAGPLGWRSEVWKTEPLTWQEIDPELARKLQTLSGKVGYLPVKLEETGEIVYAPWAKKGVWSTAYAGNYLRMVEVPGYEWIQPDWKIGAGEEIRAWRGLGDYTLRALFEREGSPVDLLKLGPVYTEVKMKGVVDIPTLTKQLEAWNLEALLLESPVVKVSQLWTEAGSLTPVTVKEVAWPVEVSPVTAPKTELSIPVPSVPVKIVEKAAELTFPAIFPSIPVQPKIEEKKELEPGLRVPIIVPVKVEPETKTGEPTFTVPIPAPSLPVKVETKTRGEPILKPSTYPALTPTIAPQQTPQQAPLQFPLQPTATVTATQPPSPPSPPSPPAPPAESELKTRVPLPYFSPPSSTTIYKPPQWRIGEYWRVDWFAKGLKLDLGLGKLARAFAPKPVKVKQVDWMKPKAKPRVKLKAEGKAKTKKKRRSRKRKVRV